MGGCRWNGNGKFEVMWLFHGATEEIVCKIRETQQKLEQVQCRLRSEKDFVQDQALHSHLDVLLEKQEVYWAQRAKQRWMYLGDKNTRFFHQSATFRACKKRIGFLKLENGTCIMDEGGIEQEFLQRFKKLFLCPQDASSSTHPQHMKYFWWTAHGIKRRKKRLPSEWRSIEMDGRWHLEHSHSKHIQLMKLKPGPAWRCFNGATLKISNQCLFKRIVKG
ncbi:hypothetical protein LOK49_LG13G00766 [Camellia lanceoleosa]|uniref:Uncharacterized protein n=1 Tax=Camellia lanceoleosa TaxID=1840588 RepID=A0ACC0FNW9_9ERIC|nr:hypothetical protein LOK49_LG13G00766 [Camellia lanceoleosa]